MGSVGRLSHHVGVSRRRHHRARPAFRRSHLGPERRLRQHKPVEQRVRPIEAKPEPALDALGGLQSHTHEPSALDWPLATVRFGDPFRWLSAGWKDFT